MGGYLLDLREVDRAQVDAVGGKGANLGELSRIEGIRVPGGFCVTTDAYRLMTRTASVDAQLLKLSRLGAADTEAIRTLSAEIRERIEGTAVPAEVAAAVAGALRERGDQLAYAVRSSATSEDLPGASFAGQHDSFLNVVGESAVLGCLQRCWASLFTERAVTYRLRNGLTDPGLAMAVVVQEMVSPRAAGIVFTADPVTSNRKVAVIEAGAGLGDALVSGRAGADVYRVRDGEVVARVIAEQPVLTDGEALRLADLARRVEAHFGGPQDIEWALDGDGFAVVQARPITMLFPIPEAADAANHVYVSVGHQQMMTDALRPLGIAMWQLTAFRPMFHAGGRLFVDVTQDLASPATRARVIAALGKSDPLIGDALATVVERTGFLPQVPDVNPVAAPPAPVTAAAEPDPAVVGELIAGSEASLAAVKREIQGRSGSGLLDFILADIQELKRLLSDPRSVRAIWTAIESTWWLDDHLEAWLGETNVTATLTQSAPSNVTSEMGLALLDVADVVRRHPQVVAYLERVGGDQRFLDQLDSVAGGREARSAIEGYLDRYGVRCAGEIDITRPRWSERPAALLPVILGHVRNFEPGAAERRFEQGRQEARAKEQELLERLRALPDGDAKAEEAERMIRRLRGFIGYREYPKYAMVSRYFVYRQALLEEAARLVDAGVLADPEDIYYLTFAELQEVARSRQADVALIRQRREAFRSYEALTPPRVLTSEGEVISGRYRREGLSPAALVGLPVSPGIAEGRARVIEDMADADLEPGDILVTAHADPSWSPLFVTIAGLVTEVGGLMTHGAVVAREYGLPAVVGVENATRLIEDGRRIRVHGGEGYVEILD